MEYLLQLLIEKIENSENQWKPGANGWKSLSNKAGNLYDDRKHLKSDVVKAAKELEKTGLVKIEWVQGYREQDIQAIRYRQEDIPALYKLYRERVDPDFCARAELLRGSERIMKSCCRNQKVAEQKKQLWKRHGDFSGKEETAGVGLMNWKIRCISGSSAKNI